MNLSEPIWVSVDGRLWHFYETDTESVCGEKMPDGKVFTLPDDPIGNTCGKCSRIFKEHACLGPLARGVIAYIQDKCHTQDDLSATASELMTSHKYGLLTNEELRLISEIGRRRRKELASVPDEPAQ